MANKVQIVEVGPRDGLQNEVRNLDIHLRYEFIRRLAKAGLKRIEVGAFVSPKWVPQMSGSDALIRKILKAKKEGLLPKTLHPSALVPNERGMTDAIGTGIKDIAIFGACSETFSKRNINCSIAESFDRFNAVMKMAEQNKIKVRGYLSTAFGCPYEGKVSESKLIRLVGKMLKLGVYEVSIGDTIGVATPRQVFSVLTKLEREYDLNQIAMHFHDTRGTALANVLASLEKGIRTFDASVGGLGGCPYAKGASGNLSTEDLCYMLEGMKIKTGIDIQSLIDIGQWIGEKIGRRLPSRLGQAGLPLHGTLN